MWFYLASEVIQGCTVAELQARMSSREFSEWLAELDMRAEESEKDEMAARVQEKLK